MGDAMTPAYHRAYPRRDWQAVSIICALPWGQFLVEERDRELNGRFAAHRADLRVEAGTTYAHRDVRAA